MRFGFYLPTHGATSRPSALKEMLEGATGPGSTRYWLPDQCMKMLPVSLDEASRAYQPPHHASQEAAVGSQHPAVT